MVFCPRVKLQIGTKVKDVFQSFQFTARFFCAYVFLVSSVVTTVTSDM